MFNRVALFICLFYTGCAASKNKAAARDTLPASALHPVGRYIFNSRQNLELIGSAVHTGFGFEGRECNVFYSLPQAGTHSYLQFELDGKYYKKVRIDAGGPPVVLRAARKGIHTIWLYKTTEAHTGPIVIEKITGRNLRPLSMAPAPFIEFIGNSITCGAAADTAEMPCNAGEYHDHHNAYDAYGPRLARALGVQYVVSSVSGIGVYRNWNSDGPAMPQVYEQADFQINSRTRWNFDLFTPRIVSIALGTNDFSNGDGKKPRPPFDSAAFVNSYVAFVEKVGSIYPQAQIALLSSPMMHGSSAAILQHCLQVVKQKADALHPLDKPVALYFFRPMQAHGCNGHPSVADHALMAEELMPFFRKLLQQQ